MRSLMDNYVFAYPLGESISREALGLPTEDDGEVMCQPIVDPGADISQIFAVTDARRRITSLLSNLMPMDRQLVERACFAGNNQADVARHFKVNDAAISKQMTRVVAPGPITLAELCTSILLQ